MRLVRCLGPGSLMGRLTVLVSNTTMALVEDGALLGSNSLDMGNVELGTSFVFRGHVAMLKYRVFVFLFVAAVILFFVGMFAGIFPMVLIGAVSLIALFLTRRAFMPVQEQRWDP